MLCILGCPFARQDFDGDSFVASQFGGEDCDDNDASVNPSVPEVCDGIDNDRDGIADNDSATDAPIWYADDDGDGYGYGYGVAPFPACERPEGYVADAGDCNDEDIAIYLGATDVWYDGVDSDCGGNSDYDKDGDGFDSAEDAPAGGTDCDDEDGSIHPDADDIWYDGVDSDGDNRNDCDQDEDGHANTGSGGDDCDDDDDAESIDALTFYADADGDRYGDANAQPTPAHSPLGMSPTFKTATTGTPRSSHRRRRSVRRPTRTRTATDWWMMTMTV